MNDEWDFIDDFVKETGLEPRDYPQRDVMRLAYNMWLVGKARGLKAVETNDMRGHQWFIVMRVM
ncbi:TPA: hypothetical protein RUY31_003622 [Klebsiella quasipneumoniae subsp. similipneumoniae]|nr:hypothetical protein [Klebsiella quasipneumoniae subsp. similipneumoniae]